MKNMRAGDDAHTHNTSLSLSRAACWPEKQQENIERRRKGHYTAERESRYVRRLLKHFCRVPAVCSWSRFTTSISRSHKTPSTPAWRNPRPIWSHVGKSDQIESDSLLSSSSINCPRSIRWPHFLLVTPYVLFIIFLRRRISKERKMHIHILRLPFGCLLAGDKAGARTPFARPSAPFYGRGLSRQVITPGWPNLMAQFGSVICLHMAGASREPRIFALRSPPIGTTWRWPRVIERSVNYCSHCDVALFMAVVVSHSRFQPVDRRFSMWSCTWPKRHTKRASLRKNRITS